jgi:hypothetical protein
MSLCVLCYFCGILWIGGKSWQFSTRGQYTSPHRSLSRTLTGQSATAAPLCSCSPCPTSTARAVTTFGEPNVSAPPPAAPAATSASGSGAPPTVSPTTRTKEPCSNDGAGLYPNAVAPFSPLPRAPPKPGAPRRVVGRAVYDLQARPRLAAQLAFAHHPFSVLHQAAMPGLRHLVCAPPDATVAVLMRYFPRNWTPTPDEVESAKAASAPPLPSGRGGVGAAQCVVCSRLRFKTRLRCCDTCGSAYCGRRACRAAHALACVPYRPHWKKASTAWPFVPPRSSATSATKTSTPTLPLFAPSACTPPAVDGPAPRLTSQDAPVVEPRKPTAAVTI